MKQAQEGADDEDMMDESEACQQPQLDAGLHHPEVNDFQRDQAGFIVSPKKQSRQQHQPKNQSLFAYRPSGYEASTVGNKKNIA